MTLGDRIVIMKDGFIMQVGTPAEVFDKPDNLFVAEFIGAPKMNVVKCGLVKDGNKMYVTPFGAKILVDGEKGQELLKRGYGSRDVILGFRPEHAVLVKNKEGAIHATIQVNEMMGSELHLHVLTDDQQSVIIRVPTIKLTEEERIGMVSGAELYFTFEGKVMHFFDPETEVSLFFDGELPEKE